MRRRPCAKSCGLLVGVVLVRAASTVTKAFTLSLRANNAVLSRCWSSEGRRWSSQIGGAVGRRRNMCRGALSRVDSGSSFGDNGSNLTGAATRRSRIRARPGASPPVSRRFSGHSSALAMMARNLESQYKNLFEDGKVEASAEGPVDLTEPMMEAMRLQWAYGFPYLPRGMKQLTHGAHYYPAAMQGAAAKLLLETVLPGETLLDPFVGGGTVLIEGMRAGRRTFGFDVSPLALFVSTGVTWMPSADTLQRLDDTALSMSKGITDYREKKISLKSWEPIRQAIASAVQSEEGKELAVPLWMCYSSALKKAAKARHKSPRVTPPTFFNKVVYAYCSRVKELQEAVLGEDGSRRFTPPVLQRMDARALVKPIPEGVDAVLTSPPYPGVYDYLSHARVVRSGLAVSSALIPETSPEDSKEEQGQEEEGRVLVEGASFAGAAVLSDAAATSASESPTAVATTATATTTTTTATAPPIAAPSWEGAGAGAASAAAAVFAGMPLPEGRNWPEAWMDSEIGAFKQFKKEQHAFSDSWQADNEQWVARMSDVLAPGGRAAIMTGNGAGVDTLQSTSVAAEKAGLKLIASVSLTAAGSWSMRTEHLILLEKPRV